MTVDTEMVYYHMKKAGNHFRVKFVDASRVVVELKYAKQLDPQAEKVTSFFPFSVTRNSKYVIGTEHVYL